MYILFVARFNNYYFIHGFFVFVIVHGTRALSGTVIEREKKDKLFAIFALTFRNVLTHVQHVLAIEYYFLS